MVRLRIIDKTKGFGFPFKISLPFAMIVLMLGLTVFAITVEPSFNQTLLFLMFLVALMFFLNYFFVSKRHSRNRGIKLAEMILTHEFIRFTRNKNTITYYLKDLKEIKITSDFFRRKSGDRSYSGELELLLHLNKNKRIVATGIIDSYEEFIKTQLIVREYYRVISVEEHGKFTSSRPLLLENRTYEELQLLKKELGIKGLYF